MSNLIEVGLVEKCVPVTEDPSRSRKGIYRIKDQFLKFHYKYIHPRAVMIESGNSEGVMENIAEDLDTYLGPVFEDIVREAFLKWCKDTKTTWDNVGGWWYKEDELDLVALSAQRNEALFGEVKWTRNPVGTEVLDRLKSRAPLVRWGKPGRKDKFLMVSSGGFTKKCLERMDAEGVAHWDMDTLKRIFWGKNG